MKRFRVILAIVTLTAVLGVTKAIAVTPEEMEQARTIAAIVYLRNANNTSDYLDKISAKKVSELERKLKDKEKQNLAKFKSVGYDRNYADWDKTKLIEYWSGVVRSPKLNLSSAGYAAKQVSSRIGAMKISAPKPKEETADVAPEQVQEQQTEQPDTFGQPAANIPAPFTEGDNTEARLNAVQDSIEALNEQAQNIESQTEQGSSNIGVYIGILAVLVILVIALIIYAVRFFSRSHNDDDEEDLRSRHESPSGRELELENKVESLTAENAELRKAIDEYKYRINYLKEEKEKAAQQAEKVEMRHRLRQVTHHEPEREPTDLLPIDAQEEEEETPLYAPVEPLIKPKASAAKSRKRVIYLGRANSQGMFVRAERDLNPAHSLFKLITNDGVTGTFTIAEDAAIEQRILASPQALLANSCNCADTDTFGKEAVATDRPGTAIFEQGRWRVLRKAMVQFV